MNSASVIRAGLRGVGARFRRELLSDFDSDRFGGMPLALPHPRHLRLVEPLGEDEIEPVVRMAPSRPYSPADHESIDLITPHPKRKILSGIGRQGELQTGRSNVQVTAQADFGEATLFTVQLDANLAGVAAGTVAYVLAIVEWTVFGISLSRTVDVALGVSISGLAESVRVRLVDATPSQYPQGVKYAGTILIATNPRPTTAVPPVLTALYTTNIASGSSTAALLVPSGGNAIAVFGSTAAGAWPVFRVRLQTANGIDILKTVAAQGSPFIPLPTGTGQAVIDNMTGGGTAADVSVLWGIDG